MHDEAGEALGTVVVFDDYTQLVKVQRMAAWREVARRIAHSLGQFVDQGRHGAARDLVDLPHVLAVLRLSGLASERVQRGLHHACALVGKVISTER